MRRLAAAALALLLAGGGAGAADCLAEVHARALAPGAAVAGDWAAWYEEPTRAYAHGILGTVPDALTLRLAVPGAAGGCTFAAIGSGPEHVFEDTVPRLADLDGDGQPEVVAVRSSLSRGAQLAVYGLRAGTLRLLDATPPIGTRFRWLAPLAPADLDGDGAVELPFVDRPHLAKVLRVWRWRAGALEPVAELPGLTNHAIGEELIGGTVRRCGAGAEMVLLSADRTRHVAVRLNRGRLIPRDLGPASGPVPECAS
ncbi:FG-GAP-like repeat-containing protein [Jannaschia sp. W003]|uniref:FG-GAP-like repeat-containing protein n=1 Tax=Jannaschia sp. W003 TaxID=2867012 RepID=UPI0021A72FD6|nr:FG-GAP-like repeat-containing protein [Jannaschia sp. W003]UWQ22784.1 FG-GAP-like repeat-containing protein [Jannaschia sp. W003]